jgi:hypothetical protein
VSRDVANDSGITGDVGFSMKLIATACSKTIVSQSQR